MGYKIDIEQYTARELYLMWLIHENPQQFLLDNGLVSHAPFVMPNKQTDLPTTSDNTDEWIDEVVLKPAQWQLDDYLKAKAAIRAKFDELERKHAAEVLRARIDELTTISEYAVNYVAGRSDMDAVPLKTIRTRLNHLTTEEKQP